MNGEVEEFEEIDLENECYICSEGNAPLSPCNCKSAYLHENCELELIKKRNSIQCSICKQNYNNITYKKTRIYQPNYAIICIKITSICAIIITGTGIYKLYLYCAVVKKGVLLLYGISFCFMGFICTVICKVLINRLNISSISLLIVKKIVVPTINPNYNRPVITDSGTYIV